MDVSTLEKVKARAFERFPIAFVITNPNIDDNPIVYVNRAFERLTGYTAAAAVGRNCRFLQGPDTDRVAVKNLREAIEQGHSHRTELLNYKADGTTFRNELFIEPITDEDGNVVAILGLQRDADSQDGAKQRIEEQLREIQHRVKNHLQMVVSMIRLQSQRADEGAATVDYANLAYRVETLQLLYQEMVKSSDETSVPMGAYISRIATTIGHLEGRENIRLNINTESFYVSVETAARVGLLASEIITNAYQHAFEGREAGLVQVSLRQLSGGVMRLEVMDDGIGIPDHIQWPRGNSMGAAIVTSLIDGIDGKINLARGVAGTTISVDVPLTEAREQHAN
ncbi:MAG: PAS domain-containing protein [Parvularculaceae bacterium]|nr:PAS domain-containing protein [Parvularculaceae bacterium]